MGMALGLGLSAAALGAQTAPSVLVERLSLGQAVLTDTFFGTVRARDLASLSYGTRGCVVSISEEAKTSREVRAGQVLVELDDQHSRLALRTAEARVLELTAALDERELSIQNAEADSRRRAEELDFVTEEFERNSTMLGRGLINETTMEAIERRYMEARFTAERAEEAIATAVTAKRRAEIALEIGELDLRSAEITLEDFALVAPFDGALVGFEANVGDCVQEGELAARIYEPQKKSVDVFFLISRLSAPNSGGLGVGASVKVTRVNGQSCAGTITRLDTEADSETQFVEATVDVEEGCAPSLFLNEAVEVEAVQSAVDQAYAVPNSAILADGTVFLVAEEGDRLEEIKAEVVMRGDRRSIVRLPQADGRLMVLAARPSLRGGMAVAPREAEG
jgi:multidrug efflux pump subunit AcrA (membrane-fusion protein)